MTVSPTPCMPSSAPVAPISAKYKSHSSITKEISLQKLHPISPSLLSWTAVNHLPSTAKPTTATSVHTAISAYSFILLLSLKTHWKLSTKSITTARPTKLLSAVSSNSCCDSLMLLFCTYESLTVALQFLQQIQIWWKPIIVNYWYKDLAQLISYLSVVLTYI